MTKRALPELVSYFAAIVPVFDTADEYRNVRALYSWLPEVNFSHQVLEKQAESLGVIRVDEVGWSDLGDPSRVLATLSRVGASAQAIRSAS